MNYRKLFGSASLFLAGAAALLSAYGSEAHADALCRSYNAACASSQSCEPVVVGYRCTTTYVYYGSVNIE